MKSFDILKFVAKVGTNQKKLSIATLIAVVILVVVSAVLISMPLFRGLGLLGLFIISFLGSATIILPGPGFVLSTLLVYMSDDWWVISCVVAGLGSAFGEMTGYLLGLSLKNISSLTKLKEIDNFISSKKVIMKLKDFIFPITLIFALLPNPFFDFVGLLAGYLKADLKLFFVITFVGKTLRYFIVLWLIAVYGDVPLFPEHL